MRTHFFPLLLTLIFCSEFIAAPGDTTWVTVFSDLKPDKHGNYDTTVNFPTGKRYRKIRMHYILGRTPCPGNPQYCGSWDYTTQIFALPANKDTVEIGRVITPFATDWLQKNKSHDYILDVTDYSSALEGSTGMRFRYDGYSWGFTFTIKVEFIEGVPPMDALSVKNIYDGYFAYGKTSDPIENRLTPVALTYTSQRAAIKNTITGHGADTIHACAEFCSKYYNLLINNLQLSQKQIWRDDCGKNQVYPQTGTWIFDRGNWCPGAIVTPIYHFLDGHTSPSTTFTADINLQPYTNPKPTGGYNIQTQLVSYSDLNHFVDASLEEIIAPSHDPNFARQNPACAQPIVRLKNTGAGNLYSVAFEYGLSGRPLSTYTWTGDMPAMQTADIVFPPSLPVMAHSVAAKFEARIVSVNGAGADQNTFNDAQFSMTKPVTLAPDEFVVQFGTNKSAVGSVSETSWKLLNEHDSVVAQRINATPNKIFNDTVRGLPAGCYRLVVEDAGCDGFSWWYYQYYQVNPGSGSLRIDRIGVNNPVLSVAGDIGCGFTRSFIVGNYPPPPAIPNPPGFEEFENRNFITVYPNPAEDEAYIQFTLEQRQEVSYNLTDISGRQIQSVALGRVDAQYERIDCSALAPGVYFVNVKVGEHMVSRKLILQ